MKALTNKFLRGLTATICLSLLWSCAQIRGINGGEKDVNPPVLTSVNPPDKSTGFRSQEISFTFDEFVQVNNLAQQLIVSPPLKKLPRYTIKGRTVTVSFQEDLLPNTTYVMQFGDAIADVHESNVLKGLNYVFSTGQQLDSLWINGKIINPWTGTAEGGTRVMLFNPDSVALTGKKPLYYTISNNNGEFLLPHLKEGNYSLYTLVDENANFIAEEGERISFSEELVAAGNDSTRIPVLQSTPTLRARPQSVDYMADSTGMITILWPGHLPRPTLRSLITGDSLVTSRELLSDSIQAWLSTPPVGDWHPIEVRADENVLDTIEIQHFTVSGLFSDLHVVNGDVLPGDSLVLESRDAIQYVNTETARLYFDSVAYASSCWKITDFNRIAVKSLMPEGAQGRIIFPPGSVTGPQGANPDSLTVEFKTARKKDLGNLRINIGNLRSSSTMALLMPESGKHWRLSPLPADGSLKFNNLRPGTYILRLFDDSDGNMLWTTCDPANKQQPEIMRTYPQKIQVRANWEVVVDWQP